MQADKLDLLVQRAFAGLAGALHAAFVCVNSMKFMFEGNYIHFPSGTTRCKPLVTGHGAYPPEANRKRANRSVIILFLPFS